MRHAFFVSLFLLLSLALFSQNIERKIIVSGGKFFFTTIDDETQIATLYSGRDTCATKVAKKFAVAAGRNFTDPINPFSWDVLGGNLFAINFLMHPLNDRNEAIKRYPLSSLKEWGTTVTPMEMIMISTDATPFAYNNPYAFVIKRSSTMNHFFFDGIAVSDTNYCMAIANNGELSFWAYNGKEWKHSEVFNFPVDSYFSLFTFNNTVYLATSVGGIYEVSLNGISSVKNKSVGSNLSNSILIINKDEKTVWYLKNSDFNQHSAINELIKKKAIRIF